MISHRSVRNRGQRPRSRYLDWHPAIVSRDDFIAVQHMLQNAKYGNRSILPELRVIRDGLLKGYVIINPRWGGFTAEDYRAASASAYDGDPPPEAVQKADLTVQANRGDFDFSGYEIALLDPAGLPGARILFLDSACLRFNAECVRKMPDVTHVELLVHPTLKAIAVRPADKDNRHAVAWMSKAGGVLQPRPVAAAAFAPVLFELFGWDPDSKYRLYGTRYQHEDGETVIFTAAGDISRAFGKDFYRKKNQAEIVRKTKENWQIGQEGCLCSTGLKLNITPYEELKAFIQEQLGDLFKEKPYEQQRNDREPD